MKKSLIISLVALSILVHAQDFEGTITWTIQTDIKDPKMKAQMEQAQQQMKDPAVQAQMKKMQEQMNDPQMKAMMESNPQMKAQMDKIMKMSAGGDMNDMMPKGIVIKIKNQNMLTHMDGGMMGGDILYLNEKGQSYHVDRENKTFSLMPKTSDNELDAKVTKTSESATILGYHCTKYKVEMTEQGKKITQYLWATTELKGIDMKRMAGQNGSGKNSFFYKEIEGVPLKMQMTMPEMEMTMEAKEVKKQSLPASEFIIPSDFKEVKGMMGN
ncbi:MAG: DUF4412 domain-containing protein [Cyclobacteriaceae bacterium]|nr:DUF4412 domain-containing protein [Cyclobacteriaceae bacterium]